MTGIDEAATGRNMLGAALAAGTENISYFQSLTFWLYKQVILPLDGFVFWVRADQLVPGAVFNEYVFNAPAPFNAGSLPMRPQPTKQVGELSLTFEAKGALHYATSLDQTEEETYSTNRILFTAEEPIEDLNSIGPNQMYVAEFKGIKFAFSVRSQFFEQGGLHHYEGNAVFSDMATQIISPENPINPNRLIVSNSLPFWLGFNNYVPYPWEPFGCPVKLYPSYLLPLNLKPPFGSVHILPESTAAIAGSPTYDKTWGRIQFTRETVRVTLYGLANDLAQDFVDFVLQWTQNNPDDMGLTNQPILRDEKKGQVELQTIAQKKAVDFNVNYYQHRSRNIARQLIKKAIVHYYPQDTEFPLPVG